MATELAFKGEAVLVEAWLGNKGIRLVETGTGRKSVRKAETGTEAEAGSEVGLEAGATEKTGLDVRAGEADRFSSPIPLLTEPQAQGAAKAKQRVEDSDAGVPRERRVSQVVGRLCTRQRCGLGHHTVSSAWEWGSRERGVPHHHISNNCRRVEQC